MYEYMRELAQALDYRDFTPLQAAAFRHPDLYDENKDIFIIGQTSAGKTLIPLLLFYQRVLRADELRQPRPRMLFVVPYRALAAQKKRELQEFFRRLDVQVVLSTAEYREHDDEIRNGDAEVAVIINEKVYKYATQEDDFLRRYDYMVLDEVGLIGDNQRGMKLDFLISVTFARRVRYPKPRMIMLGTPAYDWEAYYSEFRFTLITAEDRPVPLTEHLIQYGKEGILDVEPQLSWLRRSYLVKPGRYRAAVDRYGYFGTICELLGEPDARCSVDLPCRSDESKPCPHTGKPCISPVTMLTDTVSRPMDHILYRICAHHLAQGHQILIFINDREQVRYLCRALYRALKDLLPPCPDPAAYKERLLQTCGLDEEDVYGVMEDVGAPDAERDVYYEAFCGGIGFHSAAVPNELREHIERAFLEDRSLQIVCSTETLAFGVNSNVDAVIIASLMKPRGNTGRSIDRTVSILSANEYKNYTGRAGRLSRSRKAEDSMGYVYTLIRGGTELQEWQVLQEESAHPIAMHSLLFDNEDRTLSFFLLNLLSAGALSRDELREHIQRIPRPEGYTLRDVADELNDALSFLQSNRLICHPPIDLTQDTDTGSTFRLTNLGTCMKGFIIGEEDYVRISTAMQASISKSLLTPIDVNSILYACIRTKHAERDLSSLNPNRNTELDDRAVWEELCQLQAAYTVDLPQWLRDMGDCVRGGRLSPAEQKRLRILAALLAWTRSESPKRIVVKYGIQYALLAKVSEKICYLLEIGEAMMPLLLDQAWDRQAERWGALLEGYSREDSIRDRMNELRQLYASLFFGVNTDFWQQFMRFLEEWQGDTAGELRAAYSSGRLNPDTARRLKKLCIRYRFFRDFDGTIPEGRHEQAALLDQWTQYADSIRRMGEPYVSFFRAELGDGWEHAPVIPGRAE